jgi:hypothetical protein
MADHINFTPQAASQTLALAVTASAHTGVALPVADAQAGGDYQFFNQSTTVTIHVGLGTTAALAATAAAIPSDGNTASSFPVPPGWVIGMTLPASLFVSGIGSAAGPSNLYITVGRGQSN